MAEEGASPLAILEALLFQADEPLEQRRLQELLGAQVEVAPLLETLRAHYENRGIRLERHGEVWAFRTAPEVAPFMIRRQERPKRLSRAAMETLSIIAYQQPVTRAEIEAVRGVPVSTGTLDLMVEAGWVAPRGRKDAPGRPVMWGTTAAFLDHFALTSLDDLPRLDELEGAGLFKPLRAAPEPDEPETDDADDGAHPGEPAPS
ncbi:MAG: SMC-Scp complex subunit ScpB [Geminicoccaceae bacterium]|nr:SMC-Scp complex subunit ScpB [Geminicoccaceae bacterium]